MGRRLHRAGHLIWSHHEQTHPSGLLPAILPLVLYHGQERWHGTCCLHDHVEFGAHQAVLGPYNANFSYVLVDLRRLADVRLWGTAFGRLVLLALKYAAEGDLWDRLPQWIDLLREVLASQHGLAAMSALVRYILHTTPTGPSPVVQDFIRTSLGEPIMEVVETWADKLLSEGHKRGREEGREEGEVLGKRRILRVLAEARFGALPARFIHSLESADSDQLDRWSLRLLTAATPDQVLAEPGEDRSSL